MGFKYTCYFLSFLLLAFALSTEVVEAKKKKGQVAPTNETIVAKENRDGMCKEGIIIGRWLPDHNLSIGDRIARGVIYFIAMTYLFVGVSIVADRFMAAIEVITSQEKELTIKRPNGETQTVVVRIWNETVANLTLMALGSSAPEILLSIIEIYGQHFEAGDLGPSTIVGSAAFNLFVIIAICVYVVPSDENRRIKHLRVFFVTATWSVLAYVWLYVILAVISYGVIEVWEAVLTFLFFPLTVGTAYIADRRLLIYKYLSKSYRMNRRGVIREVEGADAENGKVNHVGDDGFKTFEEEEMNEEIKEFEQQRKDFIHMLRELRKKHPDKDMDSLEQMARDEVLNKGPKSRAFYRIQATRKLTGGGNVLKKKQEKEVEQETGKEVEQDDGIQRVFFDPGHYTVMENVGEFLVTVTREGGDLETTIYVDIRTEDGSANSGTDYNYAEGTLVFRPSETHKQFTLSVIDDDVFEEDEHFYVRISNIRIQEADGKITTIPPQSPGGTPAQVQLVSPFLATVMIMDDDHGGIFSFGEKEHEVAESVGEFEVKVCRYSGARGRVLIPYSAIDGTAHVNKDYKPCEGKLIFENNQHELTIPVRIVDEDCYEKDLIFWLELGEPKHIREGEDDDSGTGEGGGGEDTTEEDERIALLGKPRLSENNTRTQIRIKESKEFKNTVDKLIKKANVSLMVGTSSWKEQFIEAITVSPGGDDEEAEEGEGGSEKEGEEKEETQPSCGDYVMHFVTVFWKVLFAFVPPTDYWGGWACFVVSIILIGVLTAFIGDFASLFGCTVGVKDAVTAVAFVALGTSVPDTFASKVAAINDQYADSSIGNVTGSNAVNVFLGLGIAWSLAAIYHAWNGTVFYVSPGTLAFAVTVFCSEALLAIAVILLRRHKAVGGELGGPMKYKIPTSAFLVSLWLFYVLLATLESYNIIEGF